MLTAHEVPSLLKRSHIQYGYRPLHKPHFYYCKSAFTVHNELINVWTHFLPIIYLYYYYILPELALEHIRFPLCVLYSGVLALLAGSSIAHLMHSRSQMDHIFWFNIDFAGIALFSLCIGLQRYATEQNMGEMFDLLYLPSLVTVVLGLQYLSTSFLFTVNPHWKYRHVVRMITCLLLAVWLYVPLIGRYLDQTHADAKALHMHTKAFTWLLFSGIFMGGNVPERWAPGIFDLVGYGHQLFHICIIMVAWNLVDAAYIDCDMKTHDITQLKNIATLGTLLFCIAVIVYTIRKLMLIAKQKKYE